MTSTALSPVVTQFATTSNAASVQPKKFLDLCIEQLDPSVANTLESDSYWKDVAGKAAIVGSIALSALYIGGLVALGTYAPIYLAISGCISIAHIGIVVLAVMVTEYVEEKLIQPSQADADRAKDLKVINCHYQVLTGFTLEALQAILLKDSIDWKSIPGMSQNPENLHTLKPLIAFHQFWEVRIQNLKHEKQNTLQAAQDLTTANYDDNREEIDTLRSQALELERSVLESKVKDAFILAVIRQPTTTKTLDDIGYFSKFTQKERAIGNALSDARVNHFFIFNTAIAPITANEVLASTYHLSTRLLEAAQ